MLRKGTCLPFIVQTRGMMVDYSSWTFLSPDCLGSVSSLSPWFWMSCLITLYFNFFIVKCRKSHQNGSIIHNYKMQTFSKLKTLSLEQTHLATRTILSWYGYGLFIAIFSHVMETFISFSIEVLMCLHWSAALDLSVAIPNLQYMPSIVSMKLKISIFKTYLSTVIPE